MVNSGQNVITKSTIEAFYQLEASLKSISLNETPLELQFLSSSFLDIKPSCTS
jgi:hypothetical protein